MQNEDKLFEAYTKSLFCQKSLHVREVAGKQSNIFSQELPKLVSEVDKQDQFQKQLSCKDFNGVQKESEILTGEELKVLLLDLTKQLKQLYNRRDRFLIQKQQILQKYQFELDLGIMDYEFMLYICDRNIERLQIEENKQRLKILQELIK